METNPQLKIIIADDHKFFRGGFEAVLKSFRFVEKVRQAENGKVVISLLEKEIADIVFMDVNMPEMNGTEATRIISERFPLVKVIALSMHDDKENVMEVMNNGAMGYILKNTDRDEISEAIKEVISGHQYFSNGISNIFYQELISKKEIIVENIPDEFLNNERVRQIIFLLCHEFTNPEIGEILFLSKRTIETYRKETFRIIGCRGIAGLVKYGIDCGLYKDAELLKKFSDVLSKGTSDNIPE